MGESEPYTVDLGDSLILLVEGSVDGPVVVVGLHKTVEIHVVYLHTCRGEV